MLLAACFPGGCWQLLNCSTARHSYTTTSASWQNITLSRPPLDPVFLSFSFFLFFFLYSRRVLLSFTVDIRQLSLSPPSPLSHLMWESQ